MSDLVERLLARAPYYEDWARDIRNMNGHSVDADHALTAFLSSACVERET